MRTMVLLFATLAVVWPSPAEAQTVLVNDRQLDIADARPDAKGLWVSAENLKSITGFEIKEQGACLDDLCISIRSQQRATLIHEQDGKQSIDLEAFLKLVRYPYVADRDDNVWCIGLSRRTTRGDSMTQAPDFSLLDRAGKRVRLSDFRGRKVILFTWASW